MGAVFLKLSLRFSLLTEWSVCGRISFGGFHGISQRAKRRGTEKQAVTCINEGAYGSSFGCLFVFRHLAWANGVMATAEIREGDWQRSGGISGFFGLSPSFFLLVFQDGVMETLEIREGVWHRKQASSDRGVGGLSGFFELSLFYSSLSFTNGVMQRKEKKMGSLAAQG